MKRLLPALLSLTLATGAWGQTVTPSGANPAAGTIGSTSSSTASTGYLSSSNVLIPVTSTTPLPVTAGPTGPYLATPKGFQQVSVSTTAVGFTPPTGATYCYISAETAAVRERDDGPNPTSTVGALLPVSTTTIIAQMVLSISSLSAAKFIVTPSGTATLDVECYQ
jgi:hypothetical protein